MALVVSVTDFVFGREGVGTGPIPIGIWLDPGAPATTNCHALKKNATNISPIAAVRIVRRVREFILSLLPRSAAIERGAGWKFHCLFITGIRRAVTSLISLAYALHS